MVFKKVKKLAINDREDDICKTVPVKIAALQTVHDVLKFKSYTSGPNCDRVCVVALEGFHFVEEGTSADLYPVTSDQLYPSLEESLTNGLFPGDFETEMTTSIFISTILGSKQCILIDHRRSLLMMLLMF